VRQPFRNAPDSGPWVPWAEMDPRRNGQRRSRAMWCGSCRVRRSPRTTAREAERGAHCERRCALGFPRVERTPEARRRPQRAPLPSLLLRGMASWAGPRRRAVVVGVRVALRAPLTSGCILEAYEKRGALGAQQMNPNYPSRAAARRGCGATRPKRLSSSSCLITPRGPRRRAASSRACGA
jgi:hypothetical protein